MLDRLVREVAQAEQVQHLVARGQLVGPGAAAADQVAPQTPVTPAGALGDQQVLAHSGLGEQLDALERAADAAPGSDVDREATDVLAVEAHRAPVGPESRRARS